MFAGIALNELVNSQPPLVAATRICGHHQHLVMFYDSVINILGVRQFTKFTISFDSIEYGGVAVPDVLSI